MRWTQKKRWYALQTFYIHRNNISNLSDDNWNIVNDFSVSLLEAVLFPNWQLYSIIELFSDDNKKYYKIIANGLATKYPLIYYHKIWASSCSSSTVSNRIGLDRVCSWAPFKTEVQLFLFFFFDVILPTAGFEPTTY